MSLAMFAASIDDNSNITLPNNSDNSDNIINQKRHKRTQRKYPKIENFDTQKVNSVLQQIHNNTEEDDDDKGEFKLLPPPQSMGVSKTIPNQGWPSANSDNSNQDKQESFAGMDFPLGNKYVGKTPSPIYDNGYNLDLNDYNNYGDSKSVEEYYKRVLPGYQNQVNRPHYSLNQMHQEQQEIPSQDILLKKINYMISLLEDKQDEKTDNVTEEVILYSFLGIFIIFIADTFVRAGKYVR
jgi:hypothetical protein